MQTNSPLRECMAQVKEIARTIYSTSDKGSPHEDLAEKIVELAHAALAVPVKNCGVGTVQEQSERLHAYCKSHRCLYCSSGNGDECKFYRPGMKTDCKIEWANAPYKEGGAK